MNIVIRGEGQTQAVFLTGRGSSEPAWSQMTPGGQRPSRWGQAEEVKGTVGCEGPMLWPPGTQWCQRVGRPTPLTF